MSGVWQSTQGRGQGGRHAWRSSSALCIMSCCAHLQTLRIVSAADSAATCFSSASHQSSSSPDMCSVPLTSWLTSLVHHCRCACRSPAQTRTRKWPTSRLGSLVQSSRRPTRRGRLRCRAGPSLGARSCSAVMAACRARRLPLSSCLWSIASTCSTSVDAGLLALEAAAVMVPVKHSLNLQVERGYRPLKHPSQAACRAHP